MYKLYTLIVSLCVLALVLAEPRIQQVQQLRKNGGAGVGAQHPYLLLSQVARGRSGINVQGFEIVDESNDYDDDVQHDDDDDGDDDADGGGGGELDDDNENDSFEDILPSRKSKKQQRVKQSTFVVSNDDNEAKNDDDDDDDDENEHDSFSEGALSTPIRRSQLQKIIKNAKPTQMMVAREHAGAIMVPDGIIEIEGQSVVDEKTGKAALIVPRAALDAIPDGSVVALMERSANAGLIADFNALLKQQDDDDYEEEERANRVIVRRRRKGGRRNVRQRRRGYNSRRRPNSNRRRQGNGNGNGGNRRRNNVRVINASVNRRRRGNSGAVVRPIVLQG